MEHASRRYCATLAVLAAGGLIAAAPATPTSLPAVGIPGIQLTNSAADVLAEILGQQLGGNSSLIDGFFAANQQLVDTQAAQVGEIAAALAGDEGSVYVAKNTVWQFFDANNALGGAVQAALLGVLGARGTVDDAGVFTSFSPADLNASLLVDGQHVNSIPFAGLESAIGHYAGAAFFSAFIHGPRPDGGIEGGEAGQAFNQLVDSVERFNDALVDAQKVFNTDLVNYEVGMEQALFGTDSAFNGVINRAFNAFNMMFDAQQQGLNGLLGITGYDPQQLTGLLLTGSGGEDGQIFNDGTLGGLQGMFNQSLALWANVGGLFSGEDTNIPTDWDFGAALGSDDFQDAVTGFFGTLGGGPFGDVFASDGAFSDLLTDLGQLFASMMGG